MQPHDWTLVDDGPDTYGTPTFRCRACGVVALGRGFYRDRAVPYRSVHGGFVAATTVDASVVERLADGSPFAVRTEEDSGCRDAIDRLIESVDERRAAVLRRARSRLD